MVGNGVVRSGHGSVIWNIPQNGALRSVKDCVVNIGFVHGLRVSIMGCACYSRSFAPCGAPETCFATQVLWPSSPRESGLKARRMPCQAPPYGALPFRFVVALQKSIESRNCLQCGMLATSAFVGASGT